MPLEAALKLLLRALKGDARLAGNHRLTAVRAHVLELAGNAAQACSEYRTAAAVTASLAERHYLPSQAAFITSGTL